MAFILPKQPSLAESLGVGLGEGLQQLAQQKLQQVQQRNLASQLKQLLPSQPQEAQALAGLPQHLQQTALKDLLSAPKEKAFARALGVGHSGQDLGISGHNAELSDAEPRLTERQALELTKLKQKERQISSAEQKETRKYLEPFEAAHAKGQEAIRENRELKELARSGKLRAGFGQQILDKLSLGNFWRPIENELAQKDLDRQAQNAAAAFNTSRLTNLDVGLYKQSLGTLWNTSQGIFAIASLNILAQKARDALLNKRREIIRENKGIVPFDIEAQAEERAQPLLKKYADKSMQIVTSGASKFFKKQAEGVTDLQGALKLAKPGQRVIDNENGKIYNWKGEEIG